MDEQKRVLGTVTITLNEDWTLQISAQGAMEGAHFLSMASDYLAKYKDKAWEDVWTPERTKA